jgi:hypothetical protein
MGTECKRCYWLDFMRGFTAYHLGGCMTLEHYKTTEATNEDGVPVLLWKFVDENGNIWNTETSADGTEQQAKAIILHSLQNE